MGRIYRSLVWVSWGLGLLSMVTGIAFKLVPALTEMTTFSPRGGLVLSGVLFLCSLATREMERTSSPGGSNT